MTIEERADEVIYEPKDGHPLKACEVVAFASGYERGATEQKAITKKEMIDKACDVYCHMRCNADTRQMCYLSPILRCIQFEAYKRAMEE